MPSPTSGSSAPSVDDKKKDDKAYSYELVEGLPLGEYRLVVNVEPLDARIKCAKCDHVTHHTGNAMASRTPEEPGHAIRVYCCTVCGVLTSKRA